MPFKLYVFSADLKSLPPLHQVGQILRHMDAAGVPFWHSCWQTCSAWLTLGPSTAGGCGQYSLGSQFGRRSYIAESLRGSWLLSTRQQARGWGWFHTPSSGRWSFGGIGGRQFWLDDLGIYGHAGGVGCEGGFTLPRQEDGLLEALVEDSSDWMTLGSMDMLVVVVVSGKMGSLFVIWGGSSMKPINRVGESIDVLLYSSAWFFLSPYLGLALCEIFSKINLHSELS